MPLKPKKSRVEQLFIKSTKERDVEAMKYFIQGIDLPDFKEITPDAESTYYGNVSNTVIYIQPTANTFYSDFFINRIFTTRACLLLLAKRNNSE